MRCDVRHWSCPRNVFFLPWQVILCSHAGRPNGEVVESMRLEPVAPKLLDLLDHNVAAPSDCVGKVVEAQVYPTGILIEVDLWLLY